MDLAVREALQRSLGSGFRLDRELGGGGMSTVYLATDLSLDRQVVVKVLPPELSAAASADRFRREIQLVAKLQHPHVVPILSAGDADGTLYYLMPFLSGETLRARLSRDGPLKVSEAVRILRETLDALAFAHSHGVIHRDIKPENILLSASHAVVADFGVSKALKDSGALTSVGMTVGTPAYMAPEQAAADPSTDHRADLYAVAVVAYEMLSGAPPFSGTSSQVIKAHFTDAPVPLVQRRSDVPPALADVVMRALEKDPGLRPQRAEDMIAVLDAVLTPAGGETSASVVAAGATLATKPRTRARWPWAIAAAIVVFAAAGIWFVRRPTLIASAQSMAIIPFSVADGDTALVRLGQNLVTTMSASLDGVGEIRVADPMAVLSNANSLGSRIPVEAAVALARRLGVRSAVVGTLTRAGTNVRADLSMYDVAASTTPLFRVSTTMPIDGIAALTDSLTWGLLREVWAKGRAPTPYVANITTRSPVAMREFLTGEGLFARGRFDESAKAFVRAIAADTTFWFAYQRYHVALSWTENPILDTTLMHRLARHADQLPERERLLFRASDTSTTITSYARQLVDINRRFPDFAPAIQAYGELMYHQSGGAGFGAREAIATFERLAVLLPSDVGVADHWFSACIMAGDLECASRSRVALEKAIARDTARIDELHWISAQFAPLSTAELDAFTRYVGKAEQGWGSLLIFSGPLLEERPDLLRENDRLLARLVDAPGTPGLEARAARALLAIGRGEPAGIDSLRAVQPLLVPRRWRATDDQSANHAQLLLEMQGLREPERSTADEALARVAAPGTTPAELGQAHWIAGANAIWRGDSTMLRAELSALGADTSLVGRTLARSLHALRMGRAGNTRAAAESLLLVIEREHGNRLNDSLVVPIVLAADRVVGAEWLANAGKLAQADSLLRYAGSISTIAGYATAATATFAATQLQRSRIAEEMGRKGDAIKFARIFLAAFDLAGPAGQGRIEEARARLARLGGTLDGLSAAEVKR